MDSTYKADLRELNNLNFARFDAKVGERFAQIDAKFAQLEAKTERQLGQLEVALTRRMYATALGSVLTQIVALLAIMRFVNGR